MIDELLADTDAKNVEAVSSYRSNVSKFIYEKLVTDAKKSSVNGTFFTHGEQPSPDTSSTGLHGDNMVISRCDLSSMNYGFW